ncbi:hypothetical protein BGX38DRAFT_925133 [Terfezia claveryi]|nr:hypothetical protein BGX38DRAFT_925133 [Terfezia claveryi]
MEPPFFFIFLNTCYSYAAPWNPLSTPRHSSGLGTPSRLQPAPEIDLFSYVSDVNPLVVIKGSRQTHDRIVQDVGNTRDTVAMRHKLRWGTTKDSRVDFDAQSRGKARNTLGFLIDSRLTFNAHIKARTAKAAATIAILLCIQEWSD